VWSWAAGSIGELFPLALLGAPGAGLEQDFFERVRQLGFERSLYVLPEFHPEQIPGIYRGSSGLFHLGEVSAWGGPVRYALACGKPVVAEITHLAEALVGSAGFLLDARDTRQMGAALLAVVVNEEVSTSLRAAALKQAGSWKTDQFRDKLAAAYRNVLGRGKG
jgi:glycosyltransferase involved in cell wall biosynthesis